MLGVTSQNTDTCASSKQSFRMLNTYVKRVFIFVCLLQGNFIDSDFIIPVLWNLYLGVCLVHREKMPICAFGWHFKTYSSWKIAKCSVISIWYIVCTHACPWIQSSLKLENQALILDCSFIFPGSFLDGLRTSVSVISYLRLGSDEKLGQRRQ